VVPCGDLRVWNDGAVSDEGAVTAAVEMPGADVPAPPRSGTHLPLAVLSLLASALLTAGSVAGAHGLVAAVGALQAALVVSWVIGSRLPGRNGAIALGLAAAAGADALIVHDHTNGYGPIVGLVGVAVPAMFVHQLSRGIRRNRVMESMSDIAVMLVAVVAASGLILTRYQMDGARLATAVAMSIGAAIVVDHLMDMMFPVLRFDDRIDRGLPGVVLGVLAGGVVGLLALRPLFDFAGGRGAFVGAAAGAVGCLLSIGASFAGLHPSLAWAPDAEPETATRLRLRSLAAVLLTLFLAIPAGYVLINALTR